MELNNKCPIRKEAPAIHFGFSTGSEPGFGDEWWFYSPMAGGFYGLENKLYINFLNGGDITPDESLKVRLSGLIWKENFQRGIINIPVHKWREIASYLRDRDSMLSALNKGQITRKEIDDLTDILLNSGKTFLIDEKRIKEAERLRPPTISERQQNLALCIFRLTEGVFGKNIGTIHRLQSGLSIHTNHEDQVFMLSASSYCREENELASLLQEMSENGLLRQNNQGYAILQLTSEGHKLVDKAQRKYVASEQGFVAMWFGKEEKDVKEMDKIYEAGIELGIEKAGYKALRISDKEFVGEIVDEIIAEIQRSRFLVADFTGNRGGVYYEAGFARGLNIPVFYTVRKGDEDQLHFDISHLNQIIWETPEDLARKLDKRIRAIIGEGPHRENS